MGSPTSPWGTLVLPANGKAQAGAVRVVYGHGVAPQNFTQGMSSVGEVAEAGDGFGATVQLGDIDWDQCVDLIVGVPAEDARMAYSRHYYTRASDGREVLGTFALTQDTAGVDGTAEAGDR